ncbi:MAG: hypothetical protein K9K62_05990 [Desulfobacteraceae bacterium]|nr:hypothetical protein [Desulfobacteraceae bacterium]
MKKATIIALCMLLVPAVAMAMQPISESQMDTVTGQSGVSIVLDDIQIYQHMGTQETWYEDTSSDGASVGFVYSTPAYSMIYVNAIEGAADGTSAPSSIAGTGIQGQYAPDDSSNSYYDFSAATDTTDGITASALTINVSDSLSASTAINGGNGNEVAGVSIGLPTVEVYFAEGSRDIQDIAIFTEATDSSGNTITNPLDRGDAATDGAGYYSFGKLYQSAGGETLAVLDGTVEISPNDAWQ